MLLEEFRPESTAELHAGHRPQSRHSPRLDLSLAWRLGGTASLAVPAGERSGLCPCSSASIPDDTPHGAPLLAIHDVFGAQERDQPKQRSVGGDKDRHLAAVGR
jgi:hypothetical protein